MLKIPMCLTLFIFGEMFTKSLAVLSIPTRIVFGGRGEAHRGEGPLVALSAEAMSRGPLRPGWGRALSPLWTARSLQGPRISEVGELKLLGGGGVAVRDHSLRWDPTARDPGLALLLLQPGEAQQFCVLPFLLCQQTPAIRVTGNCVKVLCKPCQALDQRDVWYWL